MPGHVILSHGSDSSPEATKVSVLAAVAESLGWTSERPDYAACDARGLAGSVAPRVEQLVARVRASQVPPLLVGSSMGAFVSGLASMQAPCSGLFLLALPTNIPEAGMPFDMLSGVPTMLIHGYQDDVCPMEGALAFARSKGMPTLLLDDGHRLAEHVDVVAEQFRLFLQQGMA